MTNKAVLQNLKRGFSIKAPDIWDRLSTCPMPVRTEYETAARRKGFGIRKAAMVTAAFLLILAATMGIPYAANRSYTKTPSTKTPSVDLLSLLTVQAYAGPADAEGTRMQPNVKILMGRYSPLMNSVPGYPFEFRCPGARVRVSVDNGKLCLWGDETGSQVVSKGKNATVDGDRRIYWSPVAGGQDSRVCKNAVLKFEVLQNDTVIGTGSILLQGDGNLAYTAELIPGSK